jgi:endonuclease G
MVNKVMTSKPLVLEELKKHGAYKHRREFPSPGPELSVGKGGMFELEAGVLERIIPAQNNLLPVAFLDEGALRQKAVARLPKESTTNPLGTPWGTGFLVANAYIMTNNHVIQTKAEAKQILVQFNYQADFDGVAQPIDTWRLDPDAFFYTSVALDFTLVKVKGRPFIVKPPFPGPVPPIPGPIPPVGPGAGAAAEVAAAVVDEEALLPPALFVRYPGTRWGFLHLPKGAVAFAVDQQLNCVQHPAGRMKEVAVQQNEVTHVFADRVHYRTDTEPGSSGSAVFNNAWDLVALHHAAGDPDPAHPGTWLDNEGMRLDSIVAHLRAQFGATNPGLLAALGI